MTDDRQSASAAQRGSALRLQRPTVPVAADEKPTQPATGKAKPTPPRKINPGREQSISPWRSTVCAWLLFIVIGVGMAAGRYGGWYAWPPQFTAYGPCVAIGLHLVIIGLAFDDDWFAGALCLFVPGYSLYWLCARSGRAFFMAVVFGLLVGIGEDTWWALTDWWQQLSVLIERSLAGQR